MSIIITATGFKIGSKGRVANTPEKASAEFGKLSKGAARRARKALHAAGKVSLAAAPRAAA